VVINDSCTVYCHGWGESQSSIGRRRAWGLLPGLIVGFNFYDGVEDDNDLSFCKSSFAQKYDCKALCAVLKLLDEASCPVIHLFGYSRGGGTICNTIRRLKNYEKYRKFFKKLGISKNQANSILVRIRKGTIILDCPLVDTRVIIKYRFPSVWGLINYIVVPLITLGKHAPWKDQPIDAATFLKEFNVLLHIQYRDRVVTNLCDVDFYKALQSPTTHVLYADDNGHFHTGQTLYPCLQAFRKKYNGPYYNNASVLQVGENFLAKSQPTESDIEAYFNQYVIHM
jgi:hypothetical protein